MPIKGHRATHCKRGHELTPENRRPVGRTSRGGGECVICARDTRRRQKGSPLAGTFLPIDPRLLARQTAREQQRKICPQCGLAKGWETFTKDSSNADGLRGWCRACVHAYKFGTPDARKRNRRAWRLQKYGLSPEAFDQMVAHQGGLCAICGQACSFHEELSVDHDHETGRVRGLLCHHCNAGIGHLKDSPQLLRQAIAYLEGGGTCQLSLPALAPNTAAQI